MRIRIVRNFANYKAGQEFDWAEGMARVMVARGLIEKIAEPEPPAVEEAVQPQPRLERAIEPHRRKPKK
jgi:hypothetical protein